ncbi:MAG: methyltransferase domain-containing protein [Myxococcales bacterium]|nr:methyltransferase domain-containing protein [Myxococcales bacterium]
MTTPENDARPVPSPEEVWRRYDADEARLTAPLSTRMIELAGLAPGHHVLDLATGRGEPAIAAAKRVAPSGTVLGVDIAASMLAMARERAETEGVTNLELRAMSAESLEGVPDRRFDAALARWGLMYMNAPLRALKETARVLRDGGLFVAAVWAERERVDYFSMPRRILAELATVPPISTTTPGVFYYSSREKLREDLATAGLMILYEEDFEVAVMEADAPEEVVAWTRAFGMTKLLNALPAAVQEAWERALVLEVSAQPGRPLRLGGTTRLVVARPERR